MPVRNIISLLLPAGLLAAVFLINGCGKFKQLPRQDPDKKYNVVLVVSDALRRDVLGCYGGRALTPNIDRLAQRGVLFEKAYSTSPWTPPSAVSIFTGNYATSYPYTEFSKTMKASVPDQEVMLAEILNQLGYGTAIKNENFQAGLHNCFQGFQLLPEELIISKDSKIDLERISKAKIRENSPGYVNSFIVLNHLLTLHQEKNFFLAQWILDPHEPYMPVKKFAKRILYDPSQLSRHPNRYLSHSTLDCELNEADRIYLKARYLAEVESVDERVGYLIKMLEHKNMMSRTYFIFTSDHGEHFGEHGLYGHGIYYYQNLLRVPLIITGPNLLPGQRVAADVSLLGLMSTIKELLGVEYKDDMQGKSLVKYMSGKARSDKPVFFDDIREHLMIDALLENNFKLIPLKEGKFELYDLVNDPAELNNVAAAHEDRIQTMLPMILDNRRRNQQRQAANLSRLDGTEQELSEKEREDMLKKLKSLGYIQ